MARTWLLLLVVGFLSTVVHAQDAEVLPPAQLVLLPPANAAEVCGRGTFMNLTMHYPSCEKSFAEYHDPDLDCCQGLAHFYGMNSTLPSRNCFCDASVWSNFIALSTDHYYEFATAFLVCARQGYIIPINEEEGAGYCYGVPPDQETLDTAAVHEEATGEYDDANAWIKSLYKDHLVAFSFATSIISGVGLLLLLWPVTWELAFQLKSVMSKVS